MLLCQLWEHLDLIDPLLECPGDFDASHVTAEHDPVDSDSIAEPQDLLADLVWARPVLPQAQIEIDVRLVDSDRKSFIAPTFPASGVTENERDIWVIGGDAVHVHRVAIFRFLAAA